MGREIHGVVSEQKIQAALLHGNGQSRIRRRIRVQLDEPTRDGEREIVLVTNRKRGRAGTRKVAQLYLGRWTIERVCQEIGATPKCEIDTLAIPKAALLGLSAGLGAHNVLAEGARHRRTSSRAPGATVDPAPEVKMFPIRVFPSGGRKTRLPVRSFTRWCGSWSREAICSKLSPGCLMYSTKTERVVCVLSEAVGPGACARVACWRCWRLSCGSTAK